MSQYKWVRLATVEVATSSTTTVAALTTATGIYLQFNKGEYKALATCSSIITGRALCYCKFIINGSTVILGPTTVCVAVQPTLSVSGGIWVWCFSQMVFRDLLLYLGRE
jgi:hypothetical protein